MRQDLGGERIWSRKRRSRPEGVYTYVERERATLANKYNKLAEKPWFFNLKIKTAYEDAKKGYYVQDIISFLFAVIAFDINCFMDIILLPRLSLAQAYARKLSGFLA